MVKFSLYIFILYASFACNSFYLPMYLAHQGFTPGQIGGIVGAGSLVAIFGQPFWGYMSDKNKTIKRILFLLIPLAWVSGAGLFFSHIFALTFGMMFIFMFFFSSVGPLSDSLTIQFAFRNRRNYGSIRLWGEVGIGLSSLAIGLYTQHVGIAYLPWAYYVLSLLALLALGTVPDAPPQAAPVTLESVRKLLANRPFVFFLLFALIVAIPHRMNDGMLGLYITELGGKASMVGYAWLAGTASSALAMSLMGKILRRFKAFHVLMAASIIYAIRWLLYSLAPSPDWLILLQVFNGVTFSMFFISAITYLTSIVPDELRSTGQTIYAAVFSGLGGIIGNSAGGWSIGAIGGNLTYRIGSLLALAGFFAGIYAYRLQAESGRSDSSGSAASGSGGSSSGASGTSGV